VNEFIDSRIRVCELPLGEELIFIHPFLRFFLVAAVRAPRRAAEHGCTLSTSMVFNTGIIFRLAIAQ